MKNSVFKNIYSSNLYDVMSNKDKIFFHSNELTSLSQTKCINFDNLVQYMCKEMNIDPLKSCDALLFDFESQSHLLIEFKGGIIKGGKNPFSKADGIKNAYAKFPSSITILNAICKKHLADMSIMGVIVIEKDTTFNPEKEGIIGIPILNEIRKRVNSLSSKPSNLYPISSLFPDLIEIPFLESLYTTDKDGLNLYVEKLKNNNETINIYSYPDNEVFNFYNKN